MVPLPSSLRVPGLWLLALAGCSVPPEGWSTASDQVRPDPEVGEARIQGTVTDPAGAPLAGAWITVDPGGYEAVSGADGTYLLRHVPEGPIRLLAGASTRQGAEVTGLTVVDGQDLVQDFQLSPSLQDGSVQVWITGPDDLPVEGALVQAGTASATSDATGLAVVTGLGGQVVDVTVSDPDGARWPHTLTGVSVPLVGGVQRTASLSGRPAEGATYVDESSCLSCHADAASHGATVHAGALSSSLEGASLAWFSAGSVLDLDNGASIALSLEGSTPRATLTDAHGDALVLDVAGLIGGPAGASVPWTEADGQAWPLPLALMSDDPLWGGWDEASARLAPFEVDRWFAEDGAWAWTSRIPSPTLSAESRCFACHATGFSLATRGDGGLTMTGAQGRWDQPGVGCQRCHGPGSTHMDGSLSERLTNITQPSKLDPSRAAAVCGQCHGSFVSSAGVPFAWTPETGLLQPGELLEVTSTATSWPDGSARVPHAQLDEMAGSAHGEAMGATMQCTDCHDPHGSRSDETGSPLPHMLLLDHRDNSLCLGCHAEMTFDADASRIQTHPGHAIYDPEGNLRQGLCTSCHMAETAATVELHPSSGTGDLSSHTFRATSPQVTLDAFDAASTEVLEVGAFPPHGCLACHAYNDALWGDMTFVGPHGDPTLRSTHQGYLDAWEEMFP